MSAYPSAQIDPRARLRMSFEGRWSPLAGSRWNGRSCYQSRLLLARPGGRGRLSIRLQRRAALGISVIEPLAFDLVEH